MPRPRYGFDVTEEEIARDKRNQARWTFVAFVTVVVIYAVAAVIL